LSDPRVADDRELSRRTRSGPGRLLVAMYALFAMAATSRSLVQIATKYDEAPLAYSLSAVAAVVYIVATVCLIRGTRRARRVARIALVFELVGVLGIGTLTLIDSEAFPDQTVWSDYGLGYLLLPLIVPILGLLWLRRTEHGEPQIGGAERGGTEGGFEA
jgi:O-antigen/teichoic acid export membrane protein